MRLRTSGSYLEEEFDKRQSRADSYIFYKKNRQTGELMLILSVHPNGVIAAGKSEYVSDLKSNVVVTFARAASSCV